ncbi:GMC oxidoreductase [Komagataeibacter oboediens]|uniref:GMC family oxidoreductase n=1 Tax=Komagataeibacter oboediens TaxID=65958 RepID=A0ABS5SSQ9_9PROT|nr:GMC family oxidoreductase [Komagataeibacter oboediens]MBL7233219.1 GMC family oxidoreductase [Komagataeibacter oboediens]MBT0676749.1 GMC family oxidoreductase [Komagataeibacter oboediens]MBT0680020.1 GMC family oxidoreductase [Komagataeibacter oboediens]MBV1823902.1 GMC family oxidoreductase [Komagataeibacter oboediens]
MTGTGYDVIVVGSGAAGGFAAKELTEQGLSVLVIEAGRSLSDSDIKPPANRSGGDNVQLFPRIRATLSGQHIQSRVAFFSETLKHLFVNDRQHGYTTPKDAPFLWIRGRQAGGRLHAFGRVLFRWSDYDFKGADKGDGGVDWPLSYADLAPWYDRVETFLGIHGTHDGIETAPDGVMAQSTPLTPEERSFRSAVEARWPNRHVVPWRFNPHNGGPMPSSLRAAMETGRLTIRPDAVVREVMTDPASGRATGVCYVERQTGKVCVAHAKAVVVCASPIESVRLLLNSRSRLHPDGLGNSSGTLGHYFMDQCPSLMFGRWPASCREGEDAPLPVHTLFGTTGGLYIPRYENACGAHDPAFRRGYTFQGSIGRHASAGGADVPVTIMGFGEMLPYRTNAITLDPRRRDRWGVPLPHIRCVPHANERAMLRKQIRDCADMIETQGGHVDFWASPLGLGEGDAGLYPDKPFPIRWFIRKMFPKSMTMGAAIHESGGARMGNDPATSVLNPFCQSWDVPNLFVTDASSFPTGGALGTTLTVMAVSMRACHHLAEELRAGRL